MTLELRNHHFIDCKDLTLGRVSSMVGGLLSKTDDSIVLYNIPYLVVSGKKKIIFDKYLHRLNLGTKRRGPYYKKTIHGILLGAIRGMINYKKKLIYSHFVNNLSLDLGPPPQELPLMNIGKKSYSHFVYLYEISDYLNGIKSSL